MQNGQVARIIRRWHAVPLPNGKVQAQLGPGGQEIGGFWVATASALKNASAGQASGVEPCTAAPHAQAALLIDAAWQAPQAEHGVQWSASSAVAAMCSVQSATAETACWDVFLASKPMLAGVLLAWSAIECIALSGLAAACSSATAMLVAIASPIHPRKGSRVSIRMNSTTRMD